MKDNLKPMTFKEIQELIKLINKSNLTEFKMKDGEFELSIRTKDFAKTKQPAALPAQAPIIPIPPVQQTYVPPTPAPATTPVETPSAKTEEASPAKEEAADTGNYLEVKSPIVGTFYRSSSPEKPAYVKVGDTIEVGQTVCIVEAMKLFNEIETEIAGKIVKVMVEDAQPVEYDQVLFLVDPKG